MRLRRLSTTVAAGLLALLTLIALGTARGLRRLIAAAERQAEALAEREHRWQRYGR